VNVRAGYLDGSIMAATYYPPKPCACETCREARGERPTAIAAIADKARGQRGPFEEREADWRKRVDAWWPSRRR
jgi:hypothetical protein